MLLVPALVGCVCGEGLRGCKVISMKQLCYPSAVQ